MTKQEFLDRFNKKTQQPLKRGFCEIDGKKYYCLTNDGRTFSSTPCDSFLYFLILKAFHEIAKSIGEESVNPEFGNMYYDSKGFIGGDIILEDFSQLGQKIKRINCNSNSQVKNDGYLVTFDNITIADEVMQIKNLSKYYNQPHIYQQYIKQLLFHLYVGDENFCNGNIEVFIGKDGILRVSPMFDFGLVYYINDDYTSGKEGFFHIPANFYPEFAKIDYVKNVKKTFDSDFSIDKLNSYFFTDADVTSKRNILFGFGGCDLNSLLVKLIQDLDDKQFIEKLLKLNVDECLTDPIFNDEFKELIKVGIIPTKAIIQEAYINYKKNLQDEFINNKKEEYNN